MTAITSITSIKANPCWLAVVGISVSLGLCDNIRQCFSKQITDNAKHKKFKIMALMKLQGVCFYIPLVAVLLLTTSCSNSEDPSEKSVIRETQDKVAQKMTNSIKDPVDKAKVAAELINQHNQKVEEGQQ